MKPQLPRYRRLESIIHRLNHIYARRKLAGRPVAHLLPRARVLTDAYLDSRLV